MFALRKFAPGLVLLLILSVVAPLAAETSTSAAGDLFDSLRERDQVLERIARQMAHPEGVAVDADELRRFSESLQRMELWIGPLSEDHPELAWKHAALVDRARELVAAASQSRAQNANLVVPDESIRRLNLDEAAFVAADSNLADATQSACEAAPKLGVETRAISGLDGSREALVRFVAPSDGRYLVDTAGSRTDTRLLVLDGCRGTELARGDDESSLRAQTQFSARQGDEVWIRVGSDRKGHVRLAVELLVEGVGTASITGTVTAQASGMPIQSLSVRADLDGGTSWFASTDSSGNFQFTSLPAGTYEVYTRDFSGDWVNQIWDGIDCGFGSNACVGVEGDPIVVGAGQAVQDIDFSLGRSSVLSGTVSDSSSGGPVAGAQIYMYSQTGSSFYTTTDSLGRYRFAGLAPGTYFLRATSNFYDDELFDNIDCADGCMITDGTPVNVTSDANVPGVDFGLDRIGGIQGTLTAVFSGAPLYSQSIRVYDESGQYFGQTYTDSDGYFFMPVPDPGTYYARTDFYSSDNWVNQMWESVDCPETCDLGLATPIVLAGPMEVAEISFEVLEKGWIEGTVTAGDGGDLGGSFDTSVVAFDEGGSYLGDVYVNANGSYSFDYLTAGDYYAVATNFEFQVQVYDNVACAAGNPCDPLTGTPIAVAFGTASSGIDFALKRLGIIEGRVSGSFGAGVENIRVLAEDSGLEGFPNDAYTDENGDFRIVALDPGTYKLRTWSDGYLDEAFDDLPCNNGCDLSLADPVVVPGVDTLVSGIDFSLQREAWIQGTMTDAMTGDPISGYINLYASDGTWLQSTYVYSNGYLFEGLEDGSYYLVSQSSPGPYVDELHDGIYCDYSVGGVTCDLMAGTLVSVSVDSGASVDFELDRGGAIEGVVQDQFGNLIDWGEVRAFDLMGNPLAYDSTNDGAYRIEGLQPGAYYLVTRNTDHADELWPTIPCYGSPYPNCTLTDGVPVNVGLGAATTGVDFVLDELASISGTVVDAESGLTLQYSDVRLYNAIGQYVDTSYSIPFQFSEVPPGDYFLVTYGSPYHLEGIYGGGICGLTCDPTTGAPIAVEIGDVVSGIEIPLPMGPGIKGRVIDGPTGAPLAGVSIDLWDAGGEHEDSVVTDEDGWYRLSGRHGTYFLSTYNDDGLEDFLFDGIPCPDGSAWEGLCDPTTGTPYVIEEFSPLQRLDLSFGDPTIFSDGFESGNTSAWSLTVGAD